jgi:5-methylcytosine-specific restriction protein A
VRCPCKPAKLKASRKEQDAQRGTPEERGYGHRWRKARQLHLMQHPLCVECLVDEIVEPATVVDHIKPHRMDPILMWDRANWQSLCTTHHNRKTARGE